jgi:hypothetical protein
MIEMRNCGEVEKILKQRGFSKKAIEEIAKWYDDASTKEE